MHSVLLRNTHVFKVNVSLFQFQVKMSVATTGFMTQDRIDFLLGSIKKEKVVFSAPSIQWIFPGATFTCNGDNQGWIFGAQLGSNSNSSMELQIWRPTGREGSYVKVWKTAVSEPKTSNLYYYYVPSAFSFQAGDVLGYYQPFNSKLLHFYSGTG